MGIKKEQKNNKQEEKGKRIKKEARIEIKKGTKSKSKKKRETESETKKDRENERFREERTNNDGMEKVEDAVGDGEMQSEGKFESKRNKRIYRLVLLG